MQTGTIPFQILLLPFQIHISRIVKHKCYNEVIDGCDDLTLTLLASNGILGASSCVLALSASFQAVYLEEGAGVIVELDRVEHPQSRIQAVRCKAHGVSFADV